MLSLGAPPAESAEAAAPLLPIGTGARAPGAPEPAPVQAGLFPGGLWSSFHGERKRLEETGITFKLQEDIEVWTNLTGGTKQGPSYNGLTTAKLDIDLDKLTGWAGAEFFVQAFDIRGHGPSRSHVGNLQLVSNIEATPSLKLYDIWLDQTVLDGRLSLRIGQEGANDEMMTTAYGGLYLNSSFGFPGMPAAVLPSGGPNYPQGTPFVRVQWKTTDNLTVVGAVFNGDPAPTGPGDPQIRDRNGTAFRLDGHTLSIAELQYSPNPGAAAELPTTYKLGAWYASNRFADQRFDNTGGLLASPASSGLARLHTGDWAFYGIVDQAIWQRPGSNNQGIGVFLQVMAGPGDRNLSNLFIEGGINWRAPFSERPNDVFGLAASYVGISPAARSFSRDLVSFGSAATAYACNETVVEATYQALVTEWLTLQPDVQLVLNPGAGIPSAASRVPLSNAVVIGMRATIRL